MHCASALSVKIHGVFLRTASPGSAYQTFSSSKTSLVSAQLSRHEGRLPERLPGLVRAPQFPQTLRWSTTTLVPGHFHRALSRPNFCHPMGVARPGWDQEFSCCIIIQVQDWRNHSPSIGCLPLVRQIANCGSLRGCGLARSRRARYVAGNLYYFLLVVPRTKATVASATARSRRCQVPIQAGGGRGGGGGAPDALLWREVGAFVAVIHAVRALVERLRGRRCLVRPVVCCRGWRLTCLPIVWVMAALGPRTWFCAVPRPTVRLVCSRPAVRLLPRSLLCLTETKALLSRISWTSTWSVASREDQ